uniref:Homeobox domain-containing protein n=1 Tax=Caenorhabditis tropicalis TaxID=1561998 RepID=A0A1I7UJM1_9PELO
MKKPVEESTEESMWNQLKTSSDVLKDYNYLFGNRWIDGNKEKLIELTGMTERKINTILQSYRSKDSNSGIRFQSPGFSSEQKRILNETFDIRPFVDSQKITELAERTGLMRTQIATWFSRERKIRDGKVYRKNRQTPPKPLYFSIDNILSSDFPNNKKGAEPKIGHAPF